MKRSVTRMSVALGGLGLVVALSVSLGAAGASAHDQAREKAASSAHAAYDAQYSAGTVTADVVYLWSVRWYESSKKTGTALAAAQAHLTRMRSLRTQVKTRVTAGLSSSAEDKAAAYYVAEAEVWVADAGGTP